VNRGRAVRRAADLGAEAVSFWSGAKAPGLSDGEARAGGGTGGGPTVIELTDMFDDVVRSAGEPWLAEALERLAADSAAIGVLFPVVRRTCGADPLPGLPGWSADQAVRVRLLLALPLRGAALTSVVHDLYRHGDPAERIAVLRGLGPLAVRRGLGSGGLPIVRDALRSNDARLIRAAVGPYAAEHLPDADYRQAVLKCVFIGIPLAAVAGLERRWDGELSRMLADYARERRAAGREVPPDIRTMCFDHDRSDSYLDLQG